MENLNLLLMEKNMILKAFKLYPDKPMDFIALKLGLSERGLYRRMELHKIIRPPKLIIKGILQDKNNSK